MKHSSHTLATLAAIACIGLFGCGNSTDLTNTTGSLDNTSPPAPESIALVTVPTNNELTWAPSAAADVAKYQVYQYQPSPTRDNAYVMIGESTTPSYSLGCTPEATNTYFRVRAVDESGNRSGLSAEYNAFLPPLGTGSGNNNDHGDDTLLKTQE